MEQIKMFLKKLQTDEALSLALKELAQRKAGIDEVVALAAANGFTFTKEDWEATAKELAPTGELSEEQLAAVSGGATELWILVSIGTLGIGCAISNNSRDSTGCRLDT